jgi:dihydrofolate reductase
MSAAVLYMSMSLDGFIAGPNERPGNPLGDGGHRLHDWFTVYDDSGAAKFELPSSANGQIFEEMLATGAVVAGAGTFEPAGGWGGDHHDAVPIFIYSRRAPGIDISHWPLVTYLADVTTAIARAKQAAGDRNVLVHGAAVAQLALKAGTLDELELHVVPVLLGSGRRLFDHLDPEHIELERVRSLDGDNGVTHLRYRVRRTAGLAGPEQSPG